MALEGLQRLINFRRADRYHPRSCSQDRLVEAPAASNFLHEFTISHLEASHVADVPDFLQCPVSPVQQVRADVRVFMAYFSPSVFPNPRGGTMGMTIFKHLTGLGTYLGLLDKVFPKSVSPETARYSDGLVMVVALFSPLFHGLVMCLELHVDLVHPMQSVRSFLAQFMEDIMSLGIPFAPQVDTTCSNSTMLSDSKEES